MRLLKNKLLIYNSVAGIFYILGSSGSMTFMGRMMEVQFNRSSHGGTILTGPATILGMTVGLLTSGYVITKFKPAPRYLFFWNVLIGLLLSLTQVFYTQIGCDGGNQLLLNGSVISCNPNCNCDGISYSPVCDRSTGMTYFSPCHAGCKTFNEKEKVYTNCTCTTSIPLQIELFQSEVAKNRVVNKRSTSTASFLANELATESSTKEFESTEKQLTFYDVYDEELKVNNPHDETIDVNDLYDVVYDDIKDDSVEQEIEGLVKRKRRQLQTDHIVTPQACSGDCNLHYYIFTFVAMITSFINASGRIGNVLLYFRLDNVFHV